MLGHLSPQPHFVFLHGWGQSSQAWYQQVQFFQSFTSTHFISLPGHDGTPNQKAQDWTHHLEQQLHTISNKKNIILIGWSLGGQLAIAIKNNPNITSKVQGLVLISTTPCFRQQKDWAHGCNDEVWHSFSSNTTAQDPKLMQRFFQMMLHGDQLTRRDMQSIAKEAINRKDPPSLDGLSAGLHLLSDLDLRLHLQSIDTPTLIFHGQNDVITPIQAGQYLADNIPGSELHVFQDCGHAPFLTHHAEFNIILEQWWKNISV